MKEEFRCPRCNSQIKKDDPFCIGCGMSLKEGPKAIKVEKKETFEAQQIVIPPKIEKVKKTRNYNNLMLIGLSLIILILLILVVYLAFFKPVKEKIVYKEPDYQYLNISGTKMKAPLDWTFTDNKITNEKEDFVIETFLLNIASYEKFIEEDFQKGYIKSLSESHEVEYEDYQILEKDKVEYYLLESTTLERAVIGVDSSEGLFLIEVAFNQTTAYADIDKIIDFAIQIKK